MKDDPLYRTFNGKKYSLDAKSKSKKSLKKQAKKYFSSKDNYRIVKSRNGKYYLLYTTYLTTK